MSTRARPEGLASLAAILATAVLLACGGKPAESAAGTELAPSPDPSAPEETAPPAAEASEPATNPSLAPFLRPWTGDLDGMLERRVIRALVVPTRTQYWVERGQQIGVEYELLKAFEQEINRTRPTGQKNVAVHVAFVPTSRDDLIPALLEGRGDLAAGVLTITPERLRDVDFGTPFFHGVREIVVGGATGDLPASVDGLAGREVVVRRSSSYWSHLEELSRRLQARGQPAIRLRAAPEELQDDDILEMANAGLVDLTVVDRYAGLLWAKVFPHLRPREDLVVHEGGEIAWMLRKGSPRLEAAVDSFARSHGMGTAFGNTIVKRYTGSTRFVKPATSAAELAKFERMVALFRKYGDRYQLDELLMMAQGYQESRLDQAARSKSGAIGVMQILPSTGAELAVGDIRQLEPNIHGGVKYIRQIVDTYFANEPMTEANKMLFAFGAYNCGPGRMRQLRREAEQQGLDPNRWFNNVELVAARQLGAETVTYVSNIFKYYVAYKLVEEREAEARAARARAAGKP